MPRVLITALVRDNEGWLPYFFGKVAMFKEHFQNFKFETFILENDSNDNSPEIIKSNADFHACLKMGHPKDMGTRTTRLAFYRNAMKKYIKDIDTYDYVLMVDSNIFFSVGAFYELYKTITTRDQCVMACPWAMVSTSVPCMFYYDTFAMGLGQFDSVMECTTQKTAHDRHCHRVTGKEPQFKADGPNEIEVEKAFGGFVLVTKDVFKTCEWGVDTARDCEHWKFCKNVRKFGKIYITKKSKVLWSEF